MKSNLDHTATVTAAEEMDLKLNYHWGGEFHTAWAFAGFRFRRRSKWMQPSDKRQFLQFSFVGQSASPVDASLSERILLFSRASLFDRSVSQTAKRETIHWGPDPESDQSELAQEENAHCTVWLNERICRLWLRLTPMTTTGSDDFRWNSKVHRDKKRNRNRVTKIVAHTHTVNQIYWHYIWLYSSAL